MIDGDRHGLKSAVKLTFSSSKWKNFLSVVGCCSIDAATSGKLVRKSMFFKNVTHEGPYVLRREHVGLALDECRQK